MSEEEKRYCLECGKRIVPHSKPQTIRHGLITSTFSIYLSDGTEPVCFGHEKDLQKRVAVPQAFYDAFEGEVKP